MAVYFYWKRPQQLQLTVKHISFLLLPLVIVIAVVPLFLHLGALPMQLYDEARIAVSAQEMLRTHNWLVVQYGGHPDMWSVKPPLMVWLQAMSIHLFGMREWATRLPGALASTCTCLVVYLFFAQRKAPLIGLLSVCVLITSVGFVTLHCSRTGDYDALLTCFTTTYCLCYYTYTEQGKARYLYLTFLFLILAALTKGVAALLLMPALLLFTLYKKQLLTLLKNKHFYVGAACFVLLVAGYYLLREHYNPGYLQAVQQNELGGRYTQALEHNKGVFLYYYNNMLYYQFSIWIWLLLPGAIAGVFFDDGRYRDLTVYLTLLAVTFFLIISTAQTKLFWYAMPMYPFMAILVAFFIAGVWQWLRMLRVPGVILWLLLPVVFIWPYKNVLEISADVPKMGKEGWDNEHMAAYLQPILHDPTPAGKMAITYTGYHANVVWYLNALQAKRQPVYYCAPDKCGPGNVIVFQDSLKKYMETHYQTTILQTYYNVTVYQLNGTRQ